MGSGECIPKAIIDRTKAMDAQESPTSALVSGFYHHAKSKGGGTERETLRFAQTATGWIQNITLAPTHGTHEAAHEAAVPQAHMRAKLPRGSLATSKLFRHDQYPHISCTPNLFAKNHQCPPLPGVHDGLYDYWYTLSFYNTFGTCRRRQIDGTAALKVELSLSKWT